MSGGGSTGGYILRRVVDDLCSSLTFRRQHEIPPNSKATFIMFLRHVGLLGYSGAGGARLVYLYC